MTHVLQLTQRIHRPFTARMFLATCQPSNLPDAKEVVVKHMDFDDWLKMYFTKWISLTAHDDTGKAKSGDIVLVERLEKQKRRDITHRILKVVYLNGEMVDPVTGKKCVGTRYREDIKKINELWGVNPDLKFDYEKAPPRGWQEGKKDWSHKKAYRKFHEFTDRDQTEAEW